jgi:hypothetical protein
VSGPGDTHAAGTGQAHDCQLPPVGEVHRTQLRRYRQRQLPPCRYRATDDQSIIVSVSEAHLALDEQVVNQEPHTQSGRVKVAEIGWMGRVARLHRMPASHEMKTHSIH